MNATKSVKRAPRTRYSEFDVLSPGAFRQCAITLVGDAIKQRKKLIHDHNSYIHLTTEYFQVLTQYQLYSESWTVRGISRFLIKYRETLLKIIPWNNTPAISEMRRLCDLAIDFQNFA